MTRKAGQIIDRGKNKHVVRVFLGRNANGNKTYLNRTVHGNKKDAQALLTKLLREQDLGVLATRTQVTLSEYIDEWLEKAVKPRVREATHKEYAATFRRYVREPLGTMRLSTIKPTDIQGIYATMQAAGVGRTVGHVHTLLKDALNQAVKWEYLSRNPADYVDLPKRKPRNELRVMNQEEVERFLKAAERSKWSPLFHVLVGTGLRPSEAMALTWRDIDLGEARLTVRRGVRWVKGTGWVFSDPKSRSSRRTIPLPAGLVQVLSCHMDKQCELGFTDLVFCTIDGQPKHQRGIVEHAFKPALSRAGLPKEIRLYDLRHTHATLLLLANVHPKIVAERLGHSSIKITLDTYSHVLPSMQQQAASKLDSLLYGRAELSETALPN